MTHLDVLHVFGSDFTPEEAWDLVGWCHMKGATEFTLTGLVTQGAPTTAFAPFDDAAAPYKLPAASRRHLTGRPDSLVYDCELWQLTPETIAALPLAFPHGPFTYQPSDAWFEDLELYRDGELMLGFVTHEAEGVLRITPEERKELENQGVVFRRDGEWVGY